VAKRKPKAAARATPPPLPPATGSRFEQDVSRMRKRGEEMGRLRTVIEALCARTPLPQALRDHLLKGEWKGYRDCHVAPDWLIIDRKTQTELVLARTGTHSDLFDE